MLVEFYAVEIVYMCVIMICSTSYCLCNKLMDPWIVYMNVQGGTQNAIPFYHPIKIVISQYRCCKRASECCSSWKMR